MEEKSSIFREKSLEKVNSPEQLDSYLKVTSPSVWLVLIAVTIFLIGVIVWGIYGKLETTITSGAYVENKIVYCYFSEKDNDRVKKGQIIRIDDLGKEYVIENVSYAGQMKVNGSDAHFISQLSNIQENDYVYTATAKCDLEDGRYKATLVLGSVSPLSFVFN